MSDTADAAPTDAPHADDIGGMLTVQTVISAEGGQIRLRRFTAYAHGLNSPGDRGYVRATIDDPWLPAVVDWIGPTSDGTVYCIHMLTAP
jgi:hypothetical protein